MATMANDSRGSIAAIIDRHSQENLSKMALRLTPEANLLVAEDLRSKAPLPSNHSHSHGRTNAGESFCGAITVVWVLHEALMIQIFRGVAHF